MFKRNDSDSRRTTADFADDPEQTRVQSAEYTMSSTPDPSTEQEQASPTREHDAHEEASSAAMGLLFTDDQAHRLRYDWDEIQAQFVDDPRRSVQHADQLVADTLEQIARTFNDERKHLEQQWDRGNEVSTEDLRVVLQRYRSFFNRLLSV